jgi:serine/threonine protein kinase
MLEKKFDDKTDVYMYGCTCFEILTKTEPYENYSNEEFLKGFLKNELPLLSLPESTPKNISDLITSCLSARDSRPTFSEILFKLEEIENEIRAKGFETEEFGNGYSKIKLV